MAGELRTGRRTLGTTPSHRRRLSNITNLVNGSSWSNENELVKSIYNTSDLQLQQEIKKLEQIIGEKDMIIAEKDQEIESQKLFMHKMQREFYTNLCKRSQQNEEIIGYNTRLSKELSYVREQLLSSDDSLSSPHAQPPAQLKLLNHEYTQMAHVYKVNENELQTRLAEIQDQLKRFCEEKKEKGSNVQVNINEIPTNVTRRTRNSSARRHSMVGVGLDSDIWKPSTNTHSTSCLDTTTVTTRTGVRPKVTGLSQKESSSKLKIRQHDCAAMSILEPYFPTPVSACPTKRYNNRYGHLNNLEPMQEVEESESQISGSTTSRSQGNSSLESLSCESETNVIQSSSRAQNDGEVSSVSESCDAAGVTKHFEPRLVLKVQKNHYDKHPPPARPNSPQLRTSSHPATPRKRTEAHVSLQKKAASQPSTPGSTSPIRHTDSLLVPRSSLSRTPYMHKESEQSQPHSRMSVGGRPSRRASEGVISYKEPSLVSKMRRPL